MDEDLERLLGDRYEVLAQLGEGGMGSVHLLRHRHLGELRVVKRMHRSLRGDPQQTQRFLREAKLISSLEHPNLARLYDFQLDGAGGALLLMEYIPGLTLEHLRQKFGALPVSLVLMLGDQVLAALDHLHRRHVVHRDVSPDNVMVRWDSEKASPRVQLIDLGIAKTLTAAPTLSDAGAFVGKVRYSSPEQLNEGKVDGRSDLYSFGVMLYELLTGSSPIGGEGLQALVTSHLLRPPRPFEDSDPDGKVPAELRGLLLRLLAKSPGARPASAEILRSELAALEAFVKPSEADLARLETLLQTPDPPAAPSTPSSVAPTIIEESQTQTWDRPSTPAKPSKLPKPRGGRSLLLAAGLVAAGLIGLLAAWPELREPKAELATIVAPLRPEANVQTAKPEEPPVVTPPASAAMPGRLVIDASPWGEVVSMKDERAQPVALPSDPSTPLAVDLQPGTYRLIVRHGLFGQPVERRIRVEEKETHNELFVFAEEDVDALLESLGW